MKPGYDMSMESILQRHPGDEDVLYLVEYVRSLALAVRECWGRGESK